jgi:hypothetical protein
MVVKKYILFYRNILGIVLFLTFSVALCACTATEERDTKQVYYGRLIMGQWKIIYNCLGGSNKDISYTLLKPGTVLEFFVDGDLSIGSNSLASKYAFPDENHVLIESPSDQFYGAGIILKLPSPIVDTNNLVGNQNLADDLALSNINGKQMVLERVKPITVNFTPHSVQTDNCDVISTPSP